MMPGYTILFKALIMIYLIIPVGILTVLVWLCPTLIGYPKGKESPMKTLYEWGIN